MDPASPAPVVRAPRGLSRGSRAVIAILAVGVGVPLFPGVWIGSILLLDAAGIAVDPDQVLRWLLAGFAGLVLWPVVLHRVRRELWRREGGLLLQSAAVLVVLLLAAPALIVTQRPLRRLGQGHPVVARRAPDALTRPSRPGAPLGIGSRLSPAAPPSPSPTSGRGCP